MVNEYLEYILTLTILVAAAIPLSWYINKTMEGACPVLGKVLGPVERAVYRVCRIDSEEQMGWQRYVACALVFSLLSLVFVMGVLMLQGLLPLNPEGFGGLSWDLAFNTAISFVTNTDWQAYSGESTLSYFSQAIGLAVQNFVTPAVGVAVLFMLFRGIARKDAKGFGSFWADATRAVLYVFIPLSLVLSLVCVWQGTPQNFESYRQVNLIEPIQVQTQDGGTVEVDQMVVPMGPQASQVAIKQLGTNGGGYNGANSASSLENPTPLTDLLQMIALLLVPVALVFSFGRFVKNRRHGYAVFAAMMVIMVVCLVAVAYFEAMGTPQLAQDGAVSMAPIGQSGGNMEGKETRFGVAASSMWAVFTTSASNGAVNAMHDSFTPIGGMIPMLLMMLGEVVFGGVGCGLYSMIGFVLVTVFIAGLMVGRTPEYLGKKVGPREMRMAMLLAITTPLCMLAACAVLCLDPSTAADLGNTGAHGFSEVLYAAASAGGNNGSAFAGFSANTPMVNVVLGIAMLVNRFVPIVAVGCLAGSLAQRHTVAESAGTLSTGNAMFVFMLVLIIVLVAALSVFPALALGPIADQLQMMGL
jgi:K+-transporting ATPase ATPase A chain